MRHPGEKHHVHAEDPPTSVPNAVPNSWQISVPPITRLKHEGPPESWTLRSPQHKHNTTRGSWRERFSSTEQVPWEKKKLGALSHSPWEEFCETGKGFEGEGPCSVPPATSTTLGHLLGVVSPRTRQALLLSPRGLVVPHWAGSAGTRVRARASCAARATPGI